MSTEMADVILAETSDKMAKAVTHAKAEFSSIRTGRAAPALVEKIPVDYYGTEVPLQQLAGFQVPEARMLLITPYDKGAMGEIERAIKGSDLGLNPMNDGKNIRIPIPELTEERRRDLVKHVKKIAEEYRVSMRNHRRDANEMIKELQKEKQVTEDDARHAQEKVQSLTNEGIERIDQTLKSKEEEIMVV